MSQVVIITQKELDIAATMTEDLHKLKGLLHDIINAGGYLSLIRYYLENKPRTNDMIDDDTMQKLLKGIDDHMIGGARDASYLLLNILRKLDGEEQV